MTDKPSCQSEINRLRTLLEEIGWDPQPDQANTFVIDFGPPHSPISWGLAAILCDVKQFIFYLNFGFLVPPDKRDDVLRSISRINWGLIIGNFELDMSDGHLRFKSSLDFDGGELSEPLIRNAILSAMRAVETYADSLMASASSKDGVENH